MHTVGSRENLVYFHVRIRIPVYTDPVQGLLETRSTGEVTSGMKHWKWRGKKSL